jgi:hypothetical protein
MSLSDRLFGTRKRDERRNGEIYHGFLRFHRLRGDSHKRLKDLIAVALRIRGRPNEPWTARITDFKDGNPRAIEGACRLFSKHFSAVPYPESTVLCCALGASKTSLVRGEPLSVLGASIAQNRGWQFRPDLLSKKTHRSLNHFKLDLRARVEEVAGTYTASTISEPCEHVVILDDYCSSGATLSEIARSIQESNPEVEVSGLALGRSRKTKSRYNGHIPRSWSALWRSPVARSMARRIKDKANSWLKKFRAPTPPKRKKSKRKK